MMQDNVIQYWENWHMYSAETVSGRHSSVDPLTTHQLILQTVSGEISLH